MEHTSEINGNLNDTNDKAIRLLLSGFFTIIFGFLMLPTAAYHPKL